MLELNKLYNMDCMDLMKEFPDNSIDLIVTDPPYPVTSRGTAGNSGGMLQKDINKKGSVFKYNDIDCTKYAPEFYRILKDGSHCYVMTNHVNLIHMLNTFTNCGFHFIKSLIWDKGNKIMGQYYMSQFEYILFFRKGRGIQINNCGTSDIISIYNSKTKDISNNNIHDTEKPIGLYELLIKNSTHSKNDIVYDAFAGSDNCEIACYNLGINYIGSELDKEYFGKATERLEAVKSQIRFDDLEEV